MPELADVERFRHVADHAAGLQIGQIKVVDPGVLRNRTVAQFRRSLRRRTFGRADRHGKWLFIPTDGPTVAVNFGMTGSLHWIVEEAPLARDDRVVFSTESGELRYRDLRKLEGLYVTASPAELDKVVGRLGPDALSIDSSDLQMRLSGRRTPIKTALMDQSLVAGIGNMLSDEILWRAHIDPRTPVNLLTKTAWNALHRNLRLVLGKAVRAGHTPRGPTWLSSARWAEATPCPACGAPLHRHRVGGRTAVSCEVCQPIGAGADHTIR